MRIAVVNCSNFVHWGAIDLLWSNMAWRALERGDEVGIFVELGAPQNPRYRKLAHAGALLFEWRGFYRSFWNELFHRWQFRKVMAFRPDVVFVNQSTPVWAADFPGMRMLMQQIRQAKIPYVMAFHQNPDRYACHSIKWLNAEPVYAAAHRVVVFSDFSSKVLERKFARKLDNVVVIPNPPDVASSEAIEWPDKSPPALAVVGRYEVTTKGQDILFEALAGLKSRGQDWIFRLFGDGPDREYLKTLAYFYGLKGLVEIGDWATDVRSVWAQHQMLVMPSRTEVLPITMIEAMVCGRPVLATPVGGIPDWIEDQRNGFLSVTDSVDALQSALLRAWEARGSWRQLGAQAHVDAMTRLEPPPGEMLYREMCSAASSHLRIE